jgi:peptidyl-prolyl cis-trans isomerase C
VRQPSLAAPLEPAPPCRPVVRCYFDVMVLSARLARSLLSSVVCAAALSSSCDGGQKSKGPAGEPIASVAGAPITIEALQKKLDEQSPFVRARYAEPGKKKEFVDGQVRFEVLAAEARARGYEDDPEVEEAIKKIIVQRLTREEFDGRVQLKDISDDELKVYFEGHKADYQKPEMARASVVTIAYGDGKPLNKDQARAAAADVAKQASAKAEDRALFKSLVEKYSTDEAIKAAGGDIRYLDQQEVEGRFGKDAAAWLFSSEDTNAVSPVFEVKTQAGEAFAVMKRTGRRKAIERDFETVKNQIKNVVYREKRTAAFNAFVESLKQKHKVVVYEDKIERLKIDAAAAAAAAAGDSHAGHGHGGGGGLGLPLAGPQDDKAAEDRE